MPFCRCGELCLDDKCSKCGFDFESRRKSASIDRWQSRYLGSIMGLDNLTTSPTEKEQCCSPLLTQQPTPIMKRINSLLDSRRVSPLIVNSPSSRRLKKEEGCGVCQKKLSGKTVRLPETQTKYHWHCLKCKSCQSPFKDTSFIIDPFSKHIYHPQCSPSLTINDDCARCAQPITGHFISLNSTTVLHPRCFRCTSCQKVLHPSSIYSEKEGAYCQTCTNAKFPNEKDIKIVPQLQSAITTPVMANSSPTIPSPVTPTDNNSPLLPGTIRPSTLMSSRGRPLPRFGVVRDCAGCNQRIHSVLEEIPGPKASKWHKKCLACQGCAKKLDSGATVHEDENTGNLKPWCTTCLLNKKHHRSSNAQKWLNNGAGVQNSPSLKRITRV